MYHQQDDEEDTTIMDDTFCLKNGINAFHR